MIILKVLVFVMAGVFILVNLLFLTQLSSLNPINTSILSILLDDEAIDHFSVSITPGMVAQAISSLALKKAAGPDGLSGENFSFSPVMSIARILTQCFRPYSLLITFRTHFGWPILFLYLRVGLLILAILPTTGEFLLVLYSVIFEFIVLHEYLFPLSIDKILKRDGKRRMIT